VQARVNEGARGRDAGDDEAARGRNAREPSELPARGWADILRRAWREMKEDRLSIIAAGVAFYALLAVFPTLLAVVGLYGLVADPGDVERQLQAFAGLLPRQAADVLLTQLHDLVQTDRKALGFGVAAGLVLALWSASAGVRTLMEALNVAYDEDERRGFLRFYGTALLLTLAGIVGFVVVVGILVAVPIATAWLSLGSTLEAIVNFARWPLLAVGVALGLAVLYRYGPSRREPRWQWVSWGAAIATVLWVLASAAFSFYVSRFGNYNETYGSAGAIVVLLTWFLLSAYVVLIGAEINAEMEKQTKRDTTKGPEQPLGERDATAADTVGGRR
jgi:membrane protein